MAVEFAKPEVTPNHITLDRANVMPGFKNFSGTKFGGNGGSKAFCVSISEELADKLVADGWNVKQTKPDEEGNVKPFLSIYVSFNPAGTTPEKKKFRDPIAWLMSENETLKLDDVSIVGLDEEKITYAKLDIKPVWGKKVGKWQAYLAVGYFFVEMDDPFANDPDVLKYKSKQDEVPFN